MDFFWWEACEEPRIGRAGVDGLPTIPQDVGSRKAAMRYPVRQVLYFFPVPVYHGLNPREPGPMGWAPEKPV
jgi:hypothetical protein